MRILGEFEDPERAERAEKGLIIRLNTLWPRGYNLTTRNVHNIGLDLRSMGRATTFRNLARLGKLDYFLSIKKFHVYRFGA
jgi:hypothetical protein